MFHLFESLPNWATAPAALTTCHTPALLHCLGESSLIARANFAINTIITYTREGCLDIASHDMSESNSREQTGIARLPVELVRQILSAIPDVQTLRSAVRSSRVFYRSFIDAESAITKAVLFNKVIQHLLPELLVAYRSSLPLDSTDSTLNRKAFRHLVHEFLRRIRTSSLKLSLQEALCLAKIHDNVERFARKFAKSALRTAPLSHTSTKARSPTESQFAYVVHFTGLRL